MGQFTTQDSWEGATQRSLDLEECRCLYSGNSSQLCPQVMQITGLDPNGDLVEVGDEEKDDSPMDISVSTEELEELMDVTYANDDQGTHDMELTMRSKQQEV